MQNIPFVDLKTQYNSIKAEIDSAIFSVLNETAFIGGKYVQNFEEQFASLYGVKHCISCGNGTDSLYIIMKMLGIGVGDEVITVANSWISSSETITQTGATPVFVDIEADYHTIDSELILSKITNKTKAIMPVHLHGQIANIEHIKEICDSNKLFLIEDCAQSHFSEYNKNRAGTYGIAASFSFYPGKNLGAYGDAGCMITNDSELANKLKMYANHGSLKKHQHQIEGINSRMDGLQAAILSAKLPHILDWTEKRIAVANQYSQNLTGIGDLVLPKVRPNSKHTFHVYVIRTKRRNELMQHLKNNGVQTAIHYPVALPNLPAYSYLNYKKEDNPIASQFQDEMLSLPMFPELSSQQMNYVVDTIKSFF
jgi:dTDP-4-amino-4,6-dideoxygalactose transaminase